MPRPRDQKGYKRGVQPDEDEANAAPFGAATTRVYRVIGDQIPAESEADTLAIEEPLEIRIGFGPEGERQRVRLSVTMRTPGGPGDESDFELAAGFLWTEGILTAPDQIETIRHLGFPSLEGGYQNVVCAELVPGATVELPNLERHVYTSSSCGVCGKTSLEAVRTSSRFTLTEGAGWQPDLIHRAPVVLREAQAVFERTGGLHAAALFDTSGNLLVLREDVGRHNAVDKLIGSQVIAGALPLTDRLLLVSGRASFELVQKAMMAGVPVLAAVGAPSSLAVQLARDCRVTLLGFVRGGRFNIYTMAERVRPA
ncbi:MAG: formate dehydrogenase accessory sulfurtransferase FdhD [Cytophagales bacterium]|nr:formate dehydrogenase accessory sulfurtransferase FdhD [Armatimonadota bacterium]